MRKSARGAVTAAAATATVPLLMLATSAPASAATTAPGPAPTVPSASASGAATGTGCPATTGRPIVDTPATYSRTVAITFDDGPNPEYTPRVLEILARHRVHATFFVVGNRAAQHPELVRQILAGGHVIANHTWSHPTSGRGFYGLTPGQVAAQMDLTTMLMQETVSVPVCFFRSPQGKDKTVAVGDAARERGLTVANFHTASDYRQPADLDPAWVSRITSRLTNIGRHPILLLHDGGGGRENSLAALERIIRWYGTRGYVFTDPAGRPFPGGLPAGARPPSTGWAVAPGSTARFAPTGAPGVPGAGSGRPAGGDGVPLPPAGSSPSAEPVQPPVPEGAGTPTSSHPSDAGDGAGGGDGTADGPASGGPSTPVSTDGGAAAGAGGAGGEGSGLPGTRSPEPKPGASGTATSGPETASPATGSPGTGSTRTGPGAQQPPTGVGVPPAGAATTVPADAPDVLESQVTAALLARVASHLARSLF